MDVNAKYEVLKENLSKLENLIVAFSGGVDSTFLAHTAHKVLGDRMLAVTAKSLTLPDRELNAAIEFATQCGMPHRIIASEEMEVEGFTRNPKNRCYLCKTELFTKLRETAAKVGFLHIAEGSNVDDLGDYRPGMQAVEEKRILSPLREAGLRKEDIRILSKKEGLSTWDKPSFACLSSRFPYGQSITREKLSAVDRAEQHLFDLGFTQVRVRHHGEVARIELLPADMKRLLEESLGEGIYKHFKEIGFKYTALDLRGYRTGSMNEEIQPKGVMSKFIKTEK